ncbi:helix-turn-helix transcriptional regulator [Thalassotalea piscium]
MKDRLITTILVLIMILNFFDVLTDISLGVPIWHIFSESIIVLISAIGAIFLIKNMYEKSARLAKLKDELLISSNQLKNVSKEMKNARMQYAEVIQSQFQQWQLTKSEQEVAMLLLKGLSFKEISSYRNTKEKTVRQQASLIYSKANVEGRHEFAAWFLEDFMLVQ